MSTQNGYLIGSETISTSNVTPNSYTGFQFNGNCIIDSIILRNYTQTDAEILSDSVTIGVEPDWTPDVLFLANMNNTTDAGNITGMTTMPTMWSLYRQEVNGDVMYKVCDVDMSIQSWIDYKVEGGGRKYEYLLFAENSTQISNAIVTDSIKPDFYGWYLIDAVDVDNGTNNDSVECYKFDLNLTSDKNTVNADITELKTYNKFPTFVIGNQDFISGAFTSILIPQINGAYDFEGISDFNDYLDNLHTFIVNKNMKYLKTRSGKMLKVLTSNNSNNSFDYQYTDAVELQPVNITIYYNQVAENEDI